MHTERTDNLKWTFAITAAALSMFALDRQIVAIAFPSIRSDLRASLQTLEWTVSGYTLSFCVLLLPSAALGDRFGRRRMFTAGIAIFTAASAACAVAPSAAALVAARVVQGAGGSLIIPLSLTILSAATPEARRGRILGSWGAFALAAEAIAERRAREEQHAEAERVAADGPLERLQACAQVGPDRRERDGDDLPVEREHRERGGRDRERPLQVVAGTGAHADRLPVRPRPVTRAVPSVHPRVYADAILGS